MPEPIHLDMCMIQDSVSQPFFWRYHFYSNGLGKYDPCPAALRETLVRETG